VELGLIPWLKNCQIKQKEVTVGKSGLTTFSSVIMMKFLEGQERRICNISNPSVRGAKAHKRTHRTRKCRQRTMIFFIGALPGVEKFKSYEKGGLKITKLLADASKVGVEIHALSLSLLPDGSIVLEKPSLKIEECY